MSESSQHPVDVDELDLAGLRDLLVRMQHRIDELIAEREHEHGSAVVSYELGYRAGQRDVDPVDVLGRDQAAGRARRIERVNGTPVGRE